MVDANILYSGTVWRRWPHEVLRHALKGDFQLVLMKGKSTFTVTEIQEIKKLISEKLRATPDKQKAVRQKIRKLGFYYSDFSTNKDGNTVEDLENLVRSGQI